jgi:hypothetical protein
MGAQGPTVLTLAHLASVASRRRAWLASPTRACSPVGPPHRRTAGRVSCATVPSARPRPYLRPPTQTAPRRWRRRRRRPPMAGRSRPSCARRWTPHTRPTRWRWRKHAPTARRCARLPWPGADRHGTHTPAAAINKSDATTVCAVHRPPAQPCPCQYQRPGPAGTVSVAPPVCLAHAAQSPVAAALHSAGTAVRGTARHGTPSARPLSHVTEAVRGGQKSLLAAAAQGHPSVVRVPVCVCVGGLSMQGTRGRGHSHRCLLPSLSLSVCVCAKERDRQSQCTFAVVALGPAPLRPRPCACVVPGTVPCHAVCVCVYVPVYAHKWVSVFLCGCVRPTALCRRGGHGPACVCLCPCVCVRLRLSSFSLHGRGLLSPSLPHTLIHAACGGASGGIESHLGRLKQQQQRVHCVGDKGPLGALWMRRLRHAWGGHSEREGGARAAASGGRAVCVCHGDQVQQCGANMQDEADTGWHISGVWTTPAS